MDRRSFFGALLGGLVGALVAPLAARRAPMTMGDVAWGKMTGAVFYRDRLPYEAPKVTYLGRIEPPFTVRDIRAAVVELRENAIQPDADGLIYIPLCP